MKTVRKGNTGEKITDCGGGAKVFVKQWRCGGGCVAVVVLGCWRCGGGAVAVVR